MMTNINGVDLYYKQSGHGYCRVLLLHGWGCDSGIFHGIAEVLSKNACVMMIDFPGHGQSARPPEPWSVSDFSRTVYQLICQTEFGPTHIIAHSFGARIALYLAAHYPEVINRIIITGGAGIRKPLSKTDVFTRYKFGLVKRITHGMKRYNIFGQLAEWLLKKASMKYGSKDYNALDAEMKKTFVNIVNDDLTPLLAKIHTPSLLIWGDKDTETPLWMGELMAKEMKDAALIVFHGAGHFAFLDDCRRFNIITNNFLVEGA